MIPITPLFSRYRDSFFLYCFWTVHLVYYSPDPNFSKILSKEFTYLYHLACILTYKDKQDTEIEELKNWLMSLPKRVYKHEQLKIMTVEKMDSLNLRAIQPKDYTFKFSTIWDTIHLLSMIVDDMVENRNGGAVSNDLLKHHLVEIKALFYNVFFRLNCSTCRDHYMTTKGQLIFYIERIETCLNRVGDNENIDMVDAILPSNVNEIVLMKHGMLYTSMVFHNHINDYRFVQRKIKNPMNYERKEWNIYKSQLDIK
ncbi:p33 [Spodoptera littoralis nucleopolyhedrovirus]|uniref:p33 n=1 Tax=Spodoptera littoralis nuclear polyhedrosis virus TaxID=10456 RepID=M1JNX2_NPVSL|nr:p33 [Spodoptera littoralis nucleopolyhedrovirus]AGE89933.1 p33 [Spodoptera littoralis nucleopolyhedrovirus]AYU75267.1 p33 [Spodoptera littoralis nucleopolyhedrovirus]